MGFIRVVHRFTHSKNLQHVPAQILSSHPLLATLLIVTLLAACSSPSAPESTTTAAKPASQAVPQEPPAKPAPQAKETQADKPALPAKKPSQAEPSHGMDATVRAANSLKNDDASRLPLHEPDWTSPTALSYRKLKKMFRSFKKKEAKPQGMIAELNGQAIQLSGAVMPLDPPDEDGVMPRFWLANPTVVMAGCVYCNPPTLADLVYVDATKNPLTVDREELYRSVVAVKLLGRFFIEHVRGENGVEYVFRLELNKVLD